MKKILLGLMMATMFHVTNSYAQFGIQAGPVGILGEAFDTADGLDKLGGALGFTFGGFYNLTVKDKLVIQPAINFLNKRWGDELLDLDNGDLTKTKVSINYLEIPVQVIINGASEKGFFAGIGPSFMFGLSGTKSVDFNGNKTNTDYNFGSEENFESPFTFGVNAMVGYNFGSIQIGLNFNQGLTNQPSEGMDQGNVNHLALRLGYLFR